MNFIEQLQNFLAAVDKSTEELRDNLCRGGYEYDNKHDVIITMDGASIKLPMHADLFCNLSELIQDEIKMEAECVPGNLKWLAEIQERVHNYHGEIQNWFITFDWYGFSIFQPFKSVQLITAVYPIEFYGKAFITSAWLTKHDTFIEKLRTTACDFIGTEYSTYREAIEMFIFTVSKEVEYKELFKSTESVLEIVNKLDDYVVCFEKLVELASKPDPKQYYAALFEEGVDADLT